MKSRSFSLFEESIKSEQSRITYTYSLKEFVRHYNIQNYDDIPKFTTNEIQDKLENWVLHLKKKRLRSATIKAKLNAVEHFLEMNKVIYHKKIISKLIPSSDYLPGGDLPFTTDEIQRMLSSTTKPRSKALILFLASTGARPASITDPVLRLKHIEDIPHNCKSVKIYDGSKEWYWAFLTPEASRALDFYLSSRRINGERLTQESPVFANLQYDTYGKKNDYMNAKSLRQLISNILLQAGIERTKNGVRYDKASIYGFRKRFNTILKLNSSVNSNIAEKLMAHKRGLDGAYLTPTREDCFAEFVKAIHDLTISDDARDKFKITKLEKERSEIEEVKQDLLNLKKDLEFELRKRASVGSFEAEAAISAYSYEGERDWLKQIDPTYFESKGKWDILKITGNLPRIFTHPKEELIDIAKDFPDLAKLIGKNGENLISQGGLLIVKESV